MTRRLITERYRALNTRLHHDVPLYGARPKQARYAEIAGMRPDGAQILDYGCGKGLLSEALDGVTNYDPATHPDLPEPHEMVVCMDVLEHVEPALIENVLAHLASVTQRMAYLVICKSKGTKRLADGSFAHKIVQPPEWWKQSLAQHFGLVLHIYSPADQHHDMTFVCWK